MKKIFLLIVLAVVLLSCSDGVKKPDLYITKNTFHSETEEQTRTAYIYEDTYIELSVNQISEGGNYHAKYKLPKKDNEDGSYTLAHLIVSDKEAITLTYETPIDFVNYMDSVGYEVTSEKKSKYGSKIYTFKKK